MVRSIREGDAQNIPQLGEAPFSSLWSPSGPPRPSDRVAESSPRRRCEPAVRVMFRPVSGRMLADEPQMAPAPNRRRAVRAGETHVHPYCPEPQPARKDRALPSTPRSSGLRTIGHARPHGPSHRRVRHRRRSCAGLDAAGHIEPRPPLTDVSVHPNRGPTSRLELGSSPLLPLASLRMVLLVHAEGTAIPASRREPRQPSIAQAVSTRSALSIACTIWVTGRDRVIRRQATRARRHRDDRRAIRA
jgi:hypothetical protein